jgi:hypothetical protein
MSCRTPPINCESSLSAAKRFICKRFVARKNHNRRDHERWMCRFLPGRKSVRSIPLGLSGKDYALPILRVEFTPRR